MTAPLGVETPFDQSAGGQALGDAPETSAPLTRPRTSPPEVWKPAPVTLVPSTPDLLNAVFVLALVSAALMGFQVVFGGTEWLWVGLLGAVGGLLVTHVCLATRQLAVVLLIGCAGATMLLSGLIFPDLATLGVFPSLASAREALQGSLRGWHDVLNVVPPVGRTGNLLAVPFSGALAATALGYSIARRSRRPGIAMLAPAALMVAAILVGTSVPGRTFGDDRAAALLLTQGLLIAVIGLAWGAAQSRRQVLVTAGRSARRPAATILTLVVASATAAAGLAQVGFLAEPRVVLRDRVVPPFDPQQYGSPLAGFRAFKNPATREEDLFSITGVAPGTPIRLATLDAYDGLVWKVAGAASQGRTASGWFERVGARGPLVAGGETTEVTLIVRKLEGVWVPGPADVVTARLEGQTGAEGEGADGLFANAATGTLALPQGLTPGKVFHEEVQLRRVVALERLPEAAQPAQVSQPAVEVPDAVRQAAQEWTEGAGTARQKVVALAERLLEGSYSDGTSGGVTIESGHGQRRLQMMVQADALAGNDEQYAALLALMLRSLDIPARVVVGFTAPAGDAAVRGKDAHAWVEVPFEGQGWVTVNATPTRELSTEKPKPKPEQNVEQAPVPPQVPQTYPLSPRPDDGGTDPARPDAPSIWPPIARWVAIGALGTTVLTSPMWALLGYKALRRRRRRSRGTPADRIGGGWNELADLSRDLGVTPARGSTRREQAALMPIAGALQLAVVADAASFAAEIPEPHRAQTYWEQVRAERAAVLAALPWRRRWRARLSPRSIWGGESRWTSS